MVNAGREWACEGVGIERKWKGWVRARVMCECACGCRCQCESVRVGVGVSVRVCV